MVAPTDDEHDAELMCAIASLTLGSEITSRALRGACHGICKSISCALSLLSAGACTPSPAYVLPVRGCRYNAMYDVIRRDLSKQLAQEEATRRVHHMHEVCIPRIGGAHIAPPRTPRQ